MTDDLHDLTAKSIYDLQTEYREYVKKSAQLCFDIGCWLPSLGNAVKRPLVPGELCFVMADTGHGKTAILQNIAVAARSLNVLMFQMELPGTLCFERFAAIANQMEQIAVENIYRDKSFVRIGHIDHIYVCEKTRLDTNKMKALLQQEWEQNDRRYELLIVDYIGLMDTKGGKSRYEQVSKAAEDLKILAKETNTIVLAATQIHRKGDDYPDEISLHDAKDSGSIENSCGLLLGAWRDKNDARTMCIRVLKNTKGSSQWEPIRADFDGPSMRITEREDYLNDFDEGLD